MVNQNCNLLCPADEIERGRLHPAEEFRDVGCSPIDSANEFSPHHAVAVDDVGLGKSEGTVERVALLSRVAHGEQIDVVFFEELQVRALVDVHTDGDYRDAFGFHPTLHFYQRGHFFHAGRTPGGPEVQNDDLSAKVAEFYGAIRILDGEFGSAGADTWRPRSGVTGGECGQENQDQRETRGAGERSHPDIIKDSCAVEEPSSVFRAESTHCWIATMIDYAGNGNIWEA